MLWVSPQLSDQLVILQSYPLLLGRYWADWRRWQFGEATQCFECCHWSVLTSFHFLCFLILPFPRHWSHGIPHDWFLRNSAAFSLQFCPKIHLVCDRKFRTTSFQIQAPKKTNDRQEIYEHTVLLSLNNLHIIHHFLCIPHNVVKHWHEDGPACEVLWFKQ